MPGCDGPGLRARGKRTPCKILRFPRKAFPHKDFRAIPIIVSAARPRLGAGCRLAISGRCRCAHEETTGQGHVDIDGGPPDATRAPLKSIRAIRIWQPFSLGRKPLYGQIPIKGTRSITGMAFAMGFVFPTVAQGTARAQNLSRRLNRKRGQLGKGLRTRMSLCTKAALARTGASGAHASRYFWTSV